MAHVSVHQIPGRRIHVSRVTEGVLEMHIYVIGPLHQTDESTRGIFLYEALDIDRSLER